MARPAGSGSELGRRQRLGRRLWTRLRRFLVLGSEGGSYYASEWTLTRENAQAVEQCVREDGPRAVAEIVRVSTEGRAPKNDPALYALALAAGVGDVDTRGRRSRRCRRSPARARTCSSSRSSWRASAAGAARSAGRSAAGTPTSRRRARLPGGEVPPARRHDPPRPAPSRAPARRSAPAIRRSTSRTSTRVCSSGSSAEARPTVSRA